MRDYVPGLAFVAHGVKLTVYIVLSRRVANQLLVVHRVHLLDQFVLLPDVISGQIILQLVDSDQDQMPESRKMTGAFNSVLLFSIYGEFVLSIDIFQAEEPRDETPAINTNQQWWS